MTKHRLQLDDDFEFLAYGLSCHWKDYRVAWLINKAMGMNLSRGTMKVEGKSGQIQEFARYVYNDESNHLNFMLLSNQNENVYLFKEWRQYDFFLLVEGYIDIFKSEEFEHDINSIDGIQFLAEMDTDVFMRLQYTIFEE